ncbi:MAG TPA: ATP-binding protein [Lacipirellulaceae bacterium]|nr:ATP-binding protein [Lacipirellulaceae bacterium]
MADEIENPSGHIDSANSLIRRLGARYLVVLALVALLMVVDQVVVQPLLVRLDAYAPAINLSGRQRMLSQKLAKAALAFQASDGEKAQNACRAELGETLDQWSHAHDALLNGDPGRGIRAIQSPEIGVQWNVLQPHFDIMCAAASRLIGRADVHSPENSTAHAVDQIAAHEAAFLSAMDRIVKLMEDEAAHEINRLRACSLAIGTAVMLLLVGLGSFVVRPATRTIRQQIEDLEARVAQRTRELADALTSLRRLIADNEASELKNKLLAAQLTHADRVASMGHLTVGLAHELNQPLGAISNYAEACDVLLAQPLELGSRRRLEENFRNIQRASMRAGQIVRRIRNFVQPSPGTTAVADINILVREVVALCRQEMVQSQVELTLDLSADDGFVTVDPIQIQQVLVNLVQNALQAMQDYSADSRRLSVCTSRSFDTVRVDVLDSGPGFAADRRENIFESFHTTKKDGLGIGLAICRSIVGDHDGTIWAESTSGNGAQVSFTLPLTQPHDAGRRIESDCVCG